MFEGSQAILAIGGLGPTEILLIFLAILLLFGAKRIPEIARGLGKGIREFKDATNDLKREMDVDQTGHRSIQPPYQGTQAPRSGQEYQQYNEAVPPPQPRAENPAAEAEKRV